MKYIEPIINPDDFEGEFPSRSDVNRMEDFLRDSRLSDTLNITIRRALIGKVEVENYQSLIVSRMEIAGDLIVVTADGYALNVTEFVADIRGAL